MDRTITMSSEENLRFLSWNSNGLKTKIKEVKSVIEKEKCHVVFLQETRTNDVLEKLEGWKSFYTTQTSPQRGVAILIRKDIFDESCYTTEKHIDDCCTVVRCTLKGQKYTLVSVYNPQADPRPLMKLQNVIERDAEGILLIGGDFNIALNPYLDRTSRKINESHLHFKPVMERFLTSFHLVDVWRRFHPTDMQFSYKQQEVESRLDYVLVPEESMQYIKKCEISSEECRSDHWPVVFEVGMFEKESTKLELCLDITETNKTQVTDLMNIVIQKWLSYKCRNVDLTINPCSPLMISVREVESAIQSLAVNQKHVDRRDGIPLSFYVNNSFALIPYLCAFYHNMLEQPMVIPEYFNEALNVSKSHYRFNVDYLILTTIMARWLRDHLESHSTDYTDDGKNKAVLLTFKEQPVNIRWTLLQDFLAKELASDKTEPPLSNKLNMDIFKRILKNSPEEQYKLLCWGCPLTPVLMTLCLKQIANEMMDYVKDTRAKIFISRENVVARFSVDFDRDFVRTLEQKYVVVECKLVD